MQCRAMVSDSMNVGEPFTERLDPLSVPERSVRMAGIHSRHTKPELVVRRLVFAMGYRYRLHRKTLPGTPDLVFPSRRKVIFVHGCFWHLHGCQTYRLPRSRRDYWLPKLEANKKRDELNQDELRRMGWKVLTLWQCELRDAESLAQKIQHFLEDDRG